jgi:glycosyltransferase involved in cell wall biosynthesis
VAGARLVVLSSRYEGMPTVLIEGLMLGGILVSTDCPTGPREILDGGRAGLLVPVRDPSALSAAMRRALTDDALRASIAARARAHAPTFAREAFRERFDALVASLAPAAR